MVNFIEPLYTKSKIKAAGKRIVDGRAGLEDILVFQNHRASHAYPLNTFQINARRHSRSVGGKVGQRLKRRNTILDKLGREPNMPLYAMQDIAGCRIVVANEADLYKVRNSLRDSRSLHKKVNDDDKYDYIKSPKHTGYRGVHDIYEYYVPHEPGSKWNGLKVEMQFRTQAQHAWATAVEVADFITTNRIKFNQANEDYMLYFQLASEIIARTSEGKFSCCGGLSPRELADAFRQQDKKLGLLTTFRNLGVSEVRKARFRPNTLLIFWSGLEAGKETLEIRNYESVNQAIEAYNELEKELGTTADIVLVRGETEETIKDVFRNYFSDAQAFVSLIDEGLKLLNRSSRRAS